ncbi:hypothetical protein R1sor_015277 [Riccia sorocarpa]|uniref:Uncharacterized protein n=1 Tax=Riccia sorocarpa TaxID=122646 RepID=A0ABD3HBS7_9MARC
MERLHQLGSFVNNAFTKTIGGIILTGLLVNRIPVNPLTTYILFFTALVLVVVAGIEHVRGKTSNSLLPVPRGDPARDLEIGRGFPDEGSNRSSGNGVESDVELQILSYEERRRGLALIITMENGGPCIDTDRLRLVDMADYMDFSPLPIVDPAAEELGNLVQKVLAHVDNEDEFIACPQLVGKPKVFLIDVCREFEQKPVVPEADQIMPEAEDCLLMYSCCPGNPALRRQTGYEKGSLFTMALINQVKWLYQTTDVQDIFSEVKRRVQESAARLEKEQVPQIHSSLSQRLSWRPR